MNSFDEAMREQHSRLAARLGAGMPRAGWKICVNDARLQKKLGLAASFVGFLEGSRCLESGACWTVEAGAVLGVEPEVALRFAGPVAPGDDAAAVRAAISGAAAAIEVVDWRDARLDLASMAATSSFHAGFVVGELRPFADVPDISGSCPGFVRGAEVLGLPDPALLPDLPTLVSATAAFLGRYGQAIQAGDWLLCGACTNPARVEPGDTVEADFGGLGSVTLNFSA